MTTHTPETAFEFHTKYAEWRKAHPNDDRLLHFGFANAQLDGGDILTTANVEEKMILGVASHNVYRTIDDIIIERADTVFLSDDLRELVTTAEVTMPDEVLFETDVYTPCGFVVFESPIQQMVTARCQADDLDNIITKVLSHGGTVTGTRLNGERNEDNTYNGYEVWEVNAIAWAHGGAVLDEARNRVDKSYGKDSLERLMLVNSAESSEADSRLFVRVFATMVYTVIDGVTISGGLLRNAPTRKLHQFIYGYGEDYTTFESDLDFGVDNEGARYHKQNRRFIVALLRLMEEYIEVDKSPVARPSSRRATRGGRTGETKTTTVLSLRRALYEEGESGTGRKVTLAHLVRGHWRRQWYPSQKTHRAKWINAHRRGGTGTESVTTKPRVIRVDR